MMAHYTDVANPGSAIGEAIGAAMENALRNKLVAIADEHSCHYLTSGVRNTKAGNKVKKLLMSDNYGNEYDIDGVLANEAMQPIIIFESKYIRYKKHNRDKGSWICTAHSAVRRRYHSIRSSIAVLAGSWSQSSQAMMTSNDINLFLIPFDYICEILSRYNIDFNWGEKEKHKATLAWNTYSELEQCQKDEIGELMASYVEHQLFDLIKKILDNTIDRTVEKVLVELVSNLGEVKVYEFANVNEAIEFLNKENLEGEFLTTDSLTLFDPPPTFEDDL
jgi:hypothetical protein